MWHFSVNIQSNNLTRCAQKRKTIHVSVSQFHSVELSNRMCHGFDHRKHVYGRHFVLTIYLLLYLVWYVHRRNYWTQWMMMGFFFFFATNWNFDIFFSFWLRLFVIYPLEIEWMYFKYFIIFVNDSVQTNWIELKRKHLFKSTAFHSLFESYLSRYYFTQIQKRKKPQQRNSFVKMGVF